MLIKFLKHGTGSAAGAAAYLTQAIDWKGQEREDVEVLRGDPQQVADVADSLKFKHKYTSAVIAWAPEDKPADEQIERTVDEFEKFAWAGMEPDRYVWTAVKHRDPDGGVHVHIVAARCDLSTGRSLNIAPPGHQQQYNALRDYLNQEHGWRSPNDPARAQELRPGYHAYLDVAISALRAASSAADRDAEQLVRAAVVLGTVAHAAARRPRRRRTIDKALVRATTNPRRIITRFLRQEIDRGTVTDRTSMVQVVKQAGFDVTRQGRDYITVADPDSEKRWRLKGAIYNQDFQAAAFLQQKQQAAEKRRGEVSTDGAGEQASAREDMERHRAVRRAYLRELSSAEKERPQTTSRTTQGLSTGTSAALSPTELRARHRAKLRAKWDREAAFHRRVSSCFPSSIIERQDTLIRNLEQSGLEVSSPDMYYLAVRDPNSGQRAGVKLSMVEGGYSLQVQDERSIPQDQSNQETNDRTRTAVDEGLEGVGRAVQEGSAAAHRAGRSLARASRKLGPGLQASREAVAEAVRIHREQQRGRARSYDSPGFDRW